MPSAYSRSESVHNALGSLEPVQHILHFSFAVYITSLKSQPDQGWILHHSRLPQWGKHIRVCVRTSWSLSYTTTFRQRLPYWYPLSHYVRTTSLGNCYCCCSHISSGPSWLFCRHASLPPELEKKVLQNIFLLIRWCVVRVRDTQAINLSYLLIVFVRVPFYFRWSTKMRGWWFVCVDSTTD